MGESKKKVWMVKCTVDMCADQEMTVLVKTTKRHLAEQLAIKEICRNGHFHAKPFYCEEATYGSKDV